MQVQSLKISEQEGNKIIVEFMGLDIDEFGVTDGFIETTIGKLKYHSSWDWLMPVIKKLNGGRPHSAMLWEDITKPLIDCDIERTWVAVVAYIKCFIKNKCMTVEDLMKPRYKVIADWPNNNVAVGTIYSDATGRHFINGLSNISRIILEKHPHLFKKLEWWEERKPEDMPQYVKGILGVFNVHWITRNSELYLSDATDPNDIWIKPNSAILPATKEEYSNQKTIE